MILLFKDANPREGEAEKRFLHEKSFLDFAPLRENKEAAHARDADKLREEGVDLVLLPFVDATKHAVERLVV